uniref:protein-tyrosine-phosphatase n=1 Tax=Clastoptera arizonana TaxID=38151 RepID=A0A1B6CFF6_9HEMI
MNSSYQPAPNTVTTNAGQNYQMAASTMNSYQPTINATTTLAGQNYQMSVSTMNSSFQPVVNTNTTIAGLNYQMNPSTINLNFQPTMDSSSTMVNQSYQVGVSAANSNYLPVMDPTTVSGGNQQTNTSQNYQTIPSGNVSQNYQMGSATNNASYLGQSQNISQSTVYPMSNYQYDLSKSSVMNPNTESYQYSYISPSPSPSHSFNKPEYPAQSSFSEYIPNHYQYSGNYPNNYPEAKQGNKNTQVNKNDSNLTQTNQNMAQQQSNAYNYNMEINQPLYGTIPTSLPEAATIKTNYGPISSDIQYTPSTGASLYSHAGLNGSSQTNLTQSAIQGQTSILQNPSQEQMPQYTQGNYYYHPYGYQYSAAVMQSMGSPTVQKMFTSPDSGVQQGPTTPQSPLTYMQASNSNLTMIFSQPTPGSLNNTVSDGNSSNVDLLAGLDFSLSQAPMVPEQEIESREVNSPKKASIVETVKVEDKLNSLHLSEDQIVQAPQVVLPKKLKDPEEKVSNKTPTKNPFSDPEVLNQFVQEMEKFEKFVETITVKTLNGPTPLDIKWKELLDIQEKDSQNRSISVARCYPVKNRYPDILPYDSSRVELPSTKDDYINASYIKNIVPSFPDYIVTQLPLQSTYGDFWTMVLEQQVELIVCLLNDNELNSQVYWPNEKGSDMVVGRLKITLQSCKICKHWIERIIYVTNTHTARVVVHLQFTQWPGSSFPASPGPFLSLVAEAMSLRTQQRGVGPCVVHCLSGVGRSGLYLLLLAAMCYIQNSHSLPELVTLAGKISTFRKNALRDKEHFKFAYQALLYYTQDLLMKRGILASRSSFVDKRPKTHSRHPSEDFLKSIPKEFDQQLQNEEKDDKDGGSSTCGSEKSGKVDPLSEIDPLWPIKRMS